jgi:hypothetical protein
MHQAGKNHLTSCRHPAAHSREGNSSCGTPHNTDVWFAPILVTLTATHIAGLVRDEKPRAMGSEPLPGQKIGPPHWIDCSLSVVVGALGGLKRPARCRLPPPGEPNVQSIALADDLDELEKGFREESPRTVWLLLVDVVRYILENDESDTRKR